MEYSLAKEFARELRKNQTEAESLMWEMVRNRNFHGYKFLRQFVIEYNLQSTKNNYYIVDFYCHEKKLIVEIDGGYHRFQLSADQERDEVLNAYGYRIIRFTNSDVLENMEQVEARLLEKLEE